MSIYFTPPGIYIVLLVIILTSTMIYRKRKWLWKEIKQFKVTEISVGPVKFGPKDGEASEGSKEIKLLKSNSSSRQSRLPGKLYNRFIGRIDELETVSNILANPREKRLIGIYGMGGVGKSALAREISERLLDEQVFCAVWWTTAKRMSLDVMDELSPDEIVSYDTILSRLSSWLGLASELRSIKDIDKRTKRIQTELTTTPILLVLDNLETATDQNEIALHVANLMSGTRSKALMTSREVWDISLPTLEGIPLQGLSETDALELLRFVARESKDDRVINATDDQLRMTAKAVGYMPLALKLAVGLMHYSDLSNILIDLEKIQGEKVTKLYDYLFSNSWRRMSKEQKELLVALSQFDDEEGISATLLRTANVIPDETFGNVIGELANRSLLEISGNLDDTRYTLHPLTINFIRSQTTQSI